MFSCKVALCLLHAILTLPSIGYLKLPNYSLLLRLECLSLTWYNMTTSWFFSHSALHLFIQPWTSSLNSEHSPSREWSSLFISLSPLPPTTVRYCDLWEIYVFGHSDDQNIFLIYICFLSTVPDSQLTKSLELPEWWEQGEHPLL